MYLRHGGRVVTVAEIAPGLLSDRKGARNRHFFDP
jgi:hypothetical protein